MIDTSAWDNAEAYLLKECYLLAIQFAQPDTAKDILRDRCDKIDVPQSDIPVRGDAASKETEMKIISDVLYDLTLEGFTASENKKSPCVQKIKSLPKSAEKEFMLALLALREGRDETQRIKALDHISAALNDSLDNPRYIALANILREAGK